MASSSKAFDIDDLDNLPDAVSPPQGSRVKRKSTQTESQKRLYQYDDDFAGNSLWLHLDFDSLDSNTVLKPTFKDSKVVAESRVVQAMDKEGLRLSGMGYAPGLLKITNKVSEQWGTHRVRVIGPSHAETLCNFYQTFTQVRIRLAPAHAKTDMPHVVPAEDDLCW